MRSSTEFDTVERCLANRPDHRWRAAPRFAAVIGDAPSRYSKSPRLWNAAFQSLNMDAAYVPFDVDAFRLGDLLRALRDCRRFLGANVTVPHKLRVMELLDAVDPGAQRIQAVNTIVRNDDGRLTGYNTDGDGFIESLRAERFLGQLSRANVLLLGAGGAARAVAVHAADELAGEIFLCNRTIAHAASLAAEIRRAGGSARAIPEDQIGLYAPRCGLIVNCTTKGQGGIRKFPDGQGTLLEPYSALAPAHPPVFPAAQFENAEFQKTWLEQARLDIRANQQASLRLAAAIPAETLFYDLIYHPEETVFLNHARSTGHRTMNGKAMIVHQAALAFRNHVCKNELRARGLDETKTQAQLVRTMVEAW